MAVSNLDFMRAQIRENVRSLTGREELATGVEVAALVRVLSNAYEALVGQGTGRGELSDSRLNLLVRLLAESQRGNAQGVSPTHLSRCLHVSKNTVSALLRGLEEQGLIERVLDPRDRRSFLIRLTPAGREMVERAVPSHIARINAPLQEFTPEEVSQLLALLTKLIQALESQQAGQLAAGETLQPSCAPQAITLNKE